MSHDVMHGRHRDSRQLAMMTRVVLVLVLVVAEVSLRYRSLHQAVPREVGVQKDGTQ